MKTYELVSRRSICGRWGLRIVGPEGTKFPAEGTLRYIPEGEGKGTTTSTYLFTPGGTDSWVLVGEDVTPIAGAAVVERMTLQSNNYISLLILGPDAVVEHHGYNRQWSIITAYARGVEKLIPESILSVMGLIDEGKVRTIEPPPSLDNVMVSAFAMVPGEKGDGK